MRQQAHSPSGIRSRWPSLNSSRTCERQPSEPCQRFGTVSANASTKSPRKPAPTTSSRPDMRHRRRAVLLAAAAEDQLLHPNSARASIRFRWQETQGRYCSKTSGPLAAELGSFLGRTSQRIDLPDNSPLSAGSAIHSPPVGSRPIANIWAQSTEGVTAGGVAQVNSVSTTCRSSERSGQTCV